jgi:hypothetical protein
MPKNNEVGVKIVSEKGEARIYLTEFVKQRSCGFDNSYAAVLNEKPLTKKQSIELGLLLIKAGQS